jgi:exopolysaccharide biosynthesis protein
MRRSALQRLLAAAVLLSAGALLHAEQRVTQPYVGVTHIDRTETAPRAVHMHIVQIDLTAPGLRFRLSPPAGGREVVRQTTLEFLKQEHAQVAINAHYFLPYPSADTDAWVIGIAASDGRVYSAFESPEQDYALLADAPGVNIDQANHATIVHRRLRQGSGGQGGDGTQIEEPVTLWTTLAGSAQIVTGGVKSIPDLAWYTLVNARTAIGLSRDGRTLTLFTVDKSGGSEGMQVGEVADLLLRDYGVWDALNLDGGGSTTMVLQDPVTHEASVVNASSDTPAGRSVGSSLAVFARPKP